MTGFTRDDLLFSLCGLNCGLCPMKLAGNCPGCGGGPGNQSCAIARCSLQHGGFQYCHQCAEYPCARYDGCEEFDSFITHRHQLANMDKARRIGPAAYAAEQNEKRELLAWLLEHCNDGRRKTLFCVGVNLLPPEDLRAAVARLKTAAGESADPKALGALAATLLQEAARQQGETLTLRKKPKAPYAPATQTERLYGEEAVQ